MNISLTFDPQDPKDQEAAKAILEALGAGGGSVTTAEPTAAEKKAAAAEKRKKAAEAKKKKEAEAKAAEEKAAADLLGGDDAGDEPEITVDQLKAAGKEYLAKHDVEALKAVFAKFKAKHVDDVKPGDYPALLEALGE